MASKIQIVSNLVQGISQQAVHNRRDAQCEAQFDCINSALLGAVARPQADLVKVYAGRNWAGAHFAETSHGPDENYLIGVSPTGVPFAVDLADGTDCTVTNSAPNYSYLTAGTGTPKAKLRTQVIEDYAFIANRTVTAAMSSTTSPAKVNEALVFVRGTAYSTNFVVSLTGTTSLSVTKTTNATTVEQTASIAAALTALINGISGYLCTQYGSTLHIRRSDGAAFTVATSDGNGDDLMRSFNGTCSSIDRLPTKAPTGLILQVNGESGTGDDDYYVQFQGDPSTGSWQEVPGPNVKINLDAATMPHALVTTGYRTFDFKRLTYGPRVAGDAVNAKEPSFIGKNIQDMVFHQRRMFMLHSGGVVASKSQNAFVYFPDTVQTVLATAPIDFTVSPGDKRGATSLDFGLAAQSTLILWSQRAQYEVFAQNDTLKQDTTEVKLMMSYEYASNVYPAPMGNFIFLVTNTGSSSSIKALTFSQSRLVGDVDVMAHATQYIPKNIATMTASETLKHIFLVSSDEPRSIYMFTYTYDPQQGFIQSAVNKWRIPGGDILWLSVRSNSLRIVQQRAEGVALLNVDLTPLVVDPIVGAMYSTRLDIRVAETQVTGLTYNSTTNTSSFTLPYAPITSEADFLVVTREDKTGGYTRGRSFIVNSVVGSVVTVTGDLTGYKFYAGHRIKAVRVESEFVLRTDKGPVPVDRLDINSFFLYLADTGYTRIEVSRPNYSTPLSYEFTGVVLGGQSAHTGTPELRNGSLKAGISENASNTTITIINDSFLPSYWQAAAYNYGAVGWAA